MGVLDRFEKGVERALSNTFAKAFKPELKPVDIASAIRREMDDRTAALARGRTVVPNTFVVELGVSDTEQIATWGEEALTQEMVDAARTAVLESKKEEIDLIMQRLSRGESFVDLVREYGEDPGMNDETNLKDGYAVHSQSVIYDPAFTKAAFSDKMQKVGDVSDPVVGSYGIHILQYLRDVPSGLILTDAIRQEIEDYLITVKTNEIYAQSFETWMTQENVVFNQEAIDTASKAAAEFVQSPEELPLEALPETEETPEEGEGAN